MRKRQPMLAIGLTALVATGLGCGGESAPARISTKVLRPDQVTVKLGPDAATPAKSEAAAEKPVETPASTQPVPPATSGEAPKGS